MMRRCPLLFSQLSSLQFGRQCFFRPLRSFGSVIATVLLASSVLALIAAAQQTPRADVITGRVLGDDGNPLVNARVFATEAEARGPNRISRSATADDEGYFRLDKLPPRLYQVSASADGYLSASVSATERPANPDERYFRPGASITITLKKGGVITGRVTSAENQVVVAVPVGLEYARDEYDRPMTRSYVAHEGWTDDRGVYRIFGIRPGSYLVRAGGRGQQSRGISAYDAQAPTYYPSATRETATEVRVLAGEEVSGVDIRYRGERGHVIRGSVAGAADINRKPHIRLINLSGPVQIGFTYTRVEAQTLKFDFEGLPDGEYELIAGRTVSDEDDGAASLPRRVTIKGADVNGIELRLIPFASISGRFVFASDSADCQIQQIQQRRQPRDVSPILHRVGAAQPEPPQNRPDQQGEFAIRGLEAGRYRLRAWLPHIEWYLRAIAMSGPASAQGPQASPMDISRHGLTLRPGERATGLVMTVAEGAAFLSGTVAPAAEGARLPTRLRVLLVPAEDASADNALRYAETDTESNGRFSLRHLAPGRYWLLARPVSDGESSESAAGTSAWNVADRLKLRREARAANVEIELHPCQRVMGHVLRYNPQ